MRPASASQRRTRSPARYVARAGAGRDRATCSGTAAGSARIPSHSLVPAEPTGAYRRRRTRVDGSRRSPSTQKWVLVVFGLAFAIAGLWVHPVGRRVAQPLRRDVPTADVRQLLLHRGVDAVPRRRRVVGVIARFGEEEIGQHHRLGRRRLPRRRARDRRRPRHHRRDEEHLHHRHGPALDGGRGFGSSTWRVRNPRLHHQPSRSCSSSRRRRAMPRWSCRSWPRSPTSPASTRSVSVTGYQSASGFVNYLTPTAAVVMGGLTLGQGRLQPLPAVPRCRILAIMFVLVVLAWSSARSRAPTAEVS